MGNDFFEEWNENEMCKLLGLGGDPRMQLEPVKNFIENAWKSRKRLMNVVNQVNVFHRDHGCARV